MINRAFRWLFEDRQTGAITIAQTPNWSLWLFIGAKATELVAPAGSIEDVAGWTATAALILWATDELVRGANPWRRCLGAGFISWQLAALMAG